MYELMVFSESVGGGFCFTKFQALCASQLSEQMWSLYQFHEAWSKLMEWLEESEKALDSELEIANDPDKIKTQLAQHKVSHSFKTRTLRFKIAADPFLSVCVFITGPEERLQSRTVVLSMGVTAPRGGQMT